MTRDEAEAIVEKYRDRWFWCGTCHCAAIRCDCCGNTSCNGSGCDKCHTETEEANSVDRWYKPEQIDLFNTPGPDLYFYATREEMDEYERQETARVAERKKWREWVATLKDRSRQA